MKQTRPPTHPGDVCRAVKGFSLDEIGPRICDVASKQLGIRRNEVHLGLRLIEDLHCDSLEIVEMIMEIEDAFDVALPDDPTDLVYKSVFTRSPFRLADIAELVYLQQGSGRIKRKGWWGNTAPAPSRQIVPFTQLGGKFDAEPIVIGRLYDELGKNARGCQTFRRRNDGMVCVQLPTTDVTIGSDRSDALPDEKPPHQVRLNSFLIDSEPVSTTAYCRFLNSLGVADPDLLKEWFQLPPEDHRREHELIRWDAVQRWKPLPGTERFPMVLVSWFGANAYSLWANGKDWHAYLGPPANDSFLPSEEQWEIRGTRGDTFNVSLG